MLRFPCPDCETGWRRADELPLSPLRRGRGDVVPCPTCQGHAFVLRRTRPIRRPAGSGTPPRGLRPAA